MPLPAPSSPLSLRDRRLWLPLLLVLLLAATLRLLPLPHEALSGDELFSRRMVSEPFALSWHHVREDLVHPPLFYLLLRAATALSGTGALALRLLPLTCGLLTLPVLVLLGNRLPGARWAGLLAASSVALGRYHLFYSQEARSYTLYTLLVLLLTLWLSYLPDPPRTRRFWLLGTALFTLLTYTHYVGGLFAALAVLAVLLARLPAAIKLRTLACALIALLLFLPWLAAERAVLRARHGVGENLDWQGHPSFYDLRQVWATALGLPDLHGATLLVLAILALTTAAALTLLARRGLLRRQPAVLALALLGWLTPLLLFVLAEPPINLPLFALRHVLPATVLLTLLAAYGLELLANALAPHRRHILAAGAACLLLLAAIPTLQTLRAGSTRIPYDQVEHLVTQQAHTGIPAFAVWFYGVAEPVNFYCDRLCVHALPTAARTPLPPRLLLLYRPDSPGERRAYRHLLDTGYRDRQHTYFAAGLATSFGTEAALLERQPAPLNASLTNPPTGR